MPTVSEIPNASILQTQLTALNTAMAALGAGAPVTNLTIQPSPTVPEGAPPGVVPMPAMPISIFLDPPITNTDTLASLVAALQAQANAVTQELVDMGYTPDPVEPPAEGSEPFPKPDWWPDNVAW